MSDCPYSTDLAWPDGLPPYKAVDDGTQNEPYEHYLWMVKNAPVLRTAGPNGDVWIVSGYDHVRKALRDRRVFSANVVTPPPFTFPTLVDGPEHTRIRHAVSQVFTRETVDDFRPELKSIVAERVDALVNAGGGDAVVDYALPVAVTSISRFVGIPVPDIAEFKRLSTETFAYLGRLATSGPGRPGDAEAAEQLFDFTRAGLVALRATNNGTAGSHIVNLWDDGYFTEREAVEFAALLFAAGHDTTTVLMANVFLELERNPKLVGDLRDNPDLAPDFVEELVRLRGTVHGVGRRTTADVTIDGVTIPANSDVRLMVTAGNLDDTKFSDPARFDPYRDTRGHLGFGHGVHSCVGAPLARAETIETVMAVVDRVEAIDLDSNRPIVWEQGITTTHSGPEHLPVVVQSRQHRD